MLKYFLVQTVMANLEVLENLNKATPKDFRFPILCKLAGVAEKHLPILQRHLIVNPPMSALIMKKLYKKSTLDECPLLTSLFGHCCEDFLQIIRGSDFFPKDHRQYTFTVGLPPSFEDRVGLEYRNEHQELVDKVNGVEIMAAKQLAKHHKSQDQLMRDTWHNAKVENLQFPLVEPNLPQFAATYNHVEPQVVAVLNHDFQWYETPAPEWKPLIQKLQRFHVNRQKANHPNMQFPPVSWMDEFMALEREAHDDSNSTVVDLTNDIAAMDVEFQHQQSPTHIAHQVALSQSFPTQDDRDQDEAAELRDTAADFSKSTLKRRASTSTPKRGEKKQKTRNPAMAKER